MSNQSGEYRIFGPPGTGKTHTLVNQIKKAAAKHGGHNVVCASFTKAAATELVTRVQGDDIDVPDANVGTIHSLCYRSLGAPKLAESQVADFNATVPEYYRLSKAVGVNARGKIEDAGATLADEPTESSSADSLFGEYNLMRNKLVPDEKMPKRVRAWAEQWERWKADNELLDFTDLLEQGVKQMLYAPNNASILFVDEAQDLTPLQFKLVRAWGKHTDYFIVVGDDDQASLPGTMVRVTGLGDIPIANLDPSEHRLTFFNKEKSFVSGVQRNGSPFQIEKSCYSGMACKVSVGECETLTTHNHKWYVQFNMDEARKKTIVYLMRKGTSFRVGWCTLIRADNVFHPRVRMNAEKADDIWILRVCDSRAEASVWESFVAAEFGISTTCFHAPQGPNVAHYTQENLDLLFSMLGDQTGRAEKCLDHFGRDIAFPFASHDVVNKYGARSHVIRACNLLPGIMLVPLHGGKTAAPWTVVADVERFHYEGGVYGLHVDMHNTYVADGIVTHNCIYGFTGATAEPLLDKNIDPSHIRVLAQSYRVPRAVHALANSWIKRVSVRQPKEYLPRDADGQVTYMNHVTFKKIDGLRSKVEQTLADGKTFMFLVSAKYQLQPVIKQLKAWGIPFHNPYRKSAGEWNPMRRTQIERLQNFLHPDGPEVGGYKLWARDQLKHWAEVCPAGGLFVRGGKAAIDKFSARTDWTQEELLDLYASAFVPEQLDLGLNRKLDWLLFHMEPKRRAGHEYLARLAKLHGEDCWDDTPRVVVGSIHSVKGAQAHVVALFQDLPPTAWKAAKWMALGHTAEDVRAAKDSIIRQYYVGMTRAREELILCGAATPYTVEVAR